MSRLAIVNGKLIDTVQGTVETRNFFLSNGVVVGLGYVPDEKEEEQEVVDLKGAHAFPYACNFGHNLLETSNLSLEELRQLGMTSLVFWPTESQLLEDLEAFNTVVSSYREYPLPVYGLGALTVDGHALTDLVGFVRAGAKGFYQEASQLDLDVFDDALSLLAALEKPLFLDLSNVMDAEERVLTTVVEQMKLYPNVHLHLMSIRAPGSIQILRDADTHNLKLTAGAVITDLVQMSEADKGVFLTAIDASIITVLTHNEAVSMATIIDMAVTDLGLDLVTLARLIGTQPLRLLGQEIGSFGIQSRPCFLALTMRGEKQPDSVICKIVVDGYLI